jgi:hypothetical protein
VLEIKIVNPSTGTTINEQKGNKIMQFTTKDLLVTVLPRREITKDCLFWTKIVQCVAHPSLGGPLPCGRCSLLVSIGCGFLGSCGPGGSACDPTIFCPGGSRDPFVIQDLEDLVTLKAELQATLKSLDAIEKEGLPSSIGSKTEAEALERGLTEALEQVRSAKKNLSRAS